MYECNEIIRTLNYTSYESEYKIMVIWMVEKLNYQAAPKLLKILEEPPDKTLFLLIAEQPDQIISTILSRLLMIKVPKINDEVLKSAIIAKLGLSEEKALATVQLSNGSFKQAMNLVREGESRQKNFDRFVSWMRICYSADVPAIAAFSEEIGRESRESIKSFLQFGMGVLRNCLMLNYTGDAFVKVIEREKPFFKNFAPFINNANSALFTSEFDRAIYHVERNAQAALLFLDLSLTVAKLLKMKEKKLVV